MDILPKKSHIGQPPADGLPDPPPEMMESDIARQRLNFGGQIWSAGNIGHFMDGRRETEMLRALHGFLLGWFSPSPTMTVQTSGSTDPPKLLEVEKKRMIASAAATCRFFHLHEGQKALLCMNLKYIGAMMMVVRALVAGMELMVTEKADGHPFARLETEIDFTAIVPLQLYNSLKDNREQFKYLRTVLVGGSAVDESLLREIRTVRTEIWSTYGMTETLSHIALRRLNGKDASAYYRPLDGVRLSTKEDGRLLLTAPHLFDGSLLTCDLAELRTDGSFRLLGRADNTVNSGGVKIRIEEVESRLSGVIGEDFAVTAVRDLRLGERLVLLCASGPDAERAERLFRAIRRRLPEYHRPKGIVAVPEIPRTENGKIDRPACRKLAESLKAKMWTERRGGG